MLTNGTRFASYSRTFCWLLAGLWLFIGLFLLTGDRSSEMLSGALWVLGAMVFFVAGLTMARKAKKTQKPNAENIG